MRPPSIVYRWSLLLFLIAFLTASDVEDIDEDGSTLLSPPTINRMPQHLMRSAPCGPELQDYCGWGYCTLEARPDGDRVPKCTCLEGYSGERCDSTVPESSENMKETAETGKSFAKELMDEKGSETCSSGSCGEETRKEEKEEQEKQEKEEQQEEKREQQEEKREQQEEKREQQEEKEELQEKKEELQEEKEELQEDEVATMDNIPADNIEVVPCGAQDKNPCLNGASCSVVIIDHSEKKEQFREIECNCAPGFEGELCERRTNATDTGDAATSVTS